MRERKWGRDLRYMPRCQRRQASSIESAGFVVELWQDFVVGDFLKILKARVSFVCFKDGEKFVSHRGFAIGRGTFRGAFGAFETANDPGWQDARRGIHRRWYKGEGRRRGGWLACGLKRGVAEENAGRDVEEGKGGKEAEMKSSPLNEGRLWFVCRVVETKPDNSPPTPRGVKRRGGGTVSVRPQHFPGRLEARACPRTLIRNHFRLTIPLAY